MRLPPYDVTYVSNIKICKYCYSIRLTAMPSDINFIRIALFVGAGGRGVKNFKLQILLVEKKFYSKLN